MSKQVQLRRGNATVNGTFIGAQGELVADTTANILVLHDGFTQGGHPVASVSYVDLAISGITASNVIAELGYTPYDANVNANAFTTLSEVANVGYLTSINSGNVTTALGYTPLDSASFTGSNVIVQLGYTPYDANVNANGYITSIDSITGSAATVTANIQANITSVGNLTSLLSTGNVTALSFYSDTGPVIGGHTAPGATGPGTVTADAWITVQAQMYPNYFQIGTFDAFSRYEIHSEMPSSVLRLGGWQTDGDAMNTGSEGIVVYGNSTIGGTLISSNGAYARIKANRFGLFAINSGLPAFSGGAYYYRVDDTEMYYTSNAGVQSFHITRDTGDTTIAGNVSALSFIGNVTGSSETANNAAYLGGEIATNYTLKTDIIAEANNASYLGGLPAADYATTAGQVTVAGAGTDQTIYTGNVQLPGTSNGVTITLPTAYSNANYRVQVTYNGFGFSISNIGQLVANVQSASQFTIYSTTGADTNYVFWTTFGSVTA